MYQTYGSITYPAADERTVQYVDLQLLYISMTMYFNSSKADLCSYVLYALMPRPVTMITACVAIGPYVSPVACVLQCQIRRPYRLSGEHSLNLGTSTIQAVI
jgi:hypothetical protein